MLSISLLHLMQEIAQTLCHATQKGCCYGCFPIMFPHLTLLSLLDPNKGDEFYTSLDIVRYHSLTFLYLPTLGCKDCAPVINLEA